ncbi:hypothetical protein ES703_69442 [subsurface metagenome]
MLIFSQLKRQKGGALKENRLPYRVEAGWLGVGSLPIDKKQRPARSLFSLLVAYQAENSWQLRPVKVDEDTEGGLTLSLFQNRVGLASMWNERQSLDC